MSTSLNRKAEQRRAYAENLLDDEYQEELKKRLKNGECSPQIEVLLHHYLLGKPVEEVVTHSTHVFANLSDTQLMDRLAFLQQQMTQLLPPAIEDSRRMAGELDAEDSREIVGTLEHGSHYEHKEHGSHLKVLA